jgi:hypothetical protein
MKAIHTLFSAGSVAVCLLVPISSHADSGTFDFLLSAVSIPTSVQMGDTTVTARSGSGTITFIRSSGGPFVEGASGTGQYASFSKKSPSGFELEADGVATFSSDDTLLLLFKRRTGDLAAGTSGEGTLHLPGGTGRFAGINGQCKYKVENLSGNWNVTIGKCQWNR